MTEKNVNKCTKTVLFRPSWDAEPLSLSTVSPEPAQAATLLRMNRLLFSATFLVIFATPPTPADQHEILIFLHLKVHVLMRAWRVGRGCIPCQLKPALDVAFNLTDFGVP